MKSSICCLFHSILLVCLLLKEAATQDDDDNGTGLNYEDNTEEQAYRDQLPSTQQDYDELVRQKQASQLKALLYKQMLQARAVDQKEQQQRKRYEEEEEYADNDEEDAYENFYDRYDNEYYAYGYSLPNGVRRYERRYYSDKYQAPIVEGFYTEARQYARGLVYELRCYRSGDFGYRTMPVRYMQRPPVVRRGRQPNVDCFN